MRIAVLTDSFPAVSETFISDQIEGLVAKGHDVEIFPEVLATSNHEGLAAWRARTDVRLVEPVSVPASKIS